MAPFAESFGSEYRRSWLQIVRITLEKAGPAFIKWGQWAATRPFWKDLSRLHTRVPAHSYAHTKRTIENAFGRKLMDIFENFEEEPVAPPSVAQVHRATLRFQYPRNEVKPILVAVKVRHPGVQEPIGRDFMMINLFAKFSQFIPTLKWMRLYESLRQFGVFMMSQVDLAREAANLNRFIYNFRQWKDVSFPKPLYPLVHPAVLVETFEQGDNVLHYVDKVKGHDQVGNSLARIGTNTLLQMLLEVENTFSFWGTAEGGLFHAAECMQQMLEQVRHHQVNIDGNVCTLLVTTLVLEDWQRKLDLEYDVLVTLQNLLFKADWAKSFLYTIERLMAP